MQSLLRNSKTIFRQLFDSESWSYTYILGCKVKNEAVIVDPVDIKAERDLQLLEELGLKLVYAINTHCHADHITGSGILRARTQCKSMISEASGAQADILLHEGDKIKFGDQVIEVLATPGHTSGCLTFVSHENRFALTGDTLLIRGCGRTDFQQGDLNMLYDMVHSKIFSLPQDYHLYPAHDYKGFSMTTVGEEKLHNPRLSKTREEFAKIMENLNLAYPKKIDEAVPWNIKCGPSQLGQAFVKQE